MLNPCPAGQQAAGRIVHTMGKFLHFGRHIHQIHIQPGGAADGLGLFKGAGEGEGASTNLSVAAQCWFCLLYTSDAADEL